MAFEFEYYWPLLLLGIIPAVWWAQRVSQTDMSTGHLRLTGTIRSGVIVLLALALMQPVLFRNGTWLSVVYLLDVSQSVSPPSVQSAFEWIDTANRQGSPDHALFIPFSSNSVAFDSVAGMKAVSVSDRPQPGAIDQTATDLEGAIERAVRSFSPNYLKRLVLLTDANENSGKIANVLARLKQDGVQVFTVPLPARATRDIWVESILAPVNVTAEELFPAEVHVFSQTTGAAEVELKLGDKSLGRRTVDLQTGLNRIAFETQVEETGPVTLDAEVKAAADTFASNNRFRQSVFVEGKPRILYAEGRAESARYLKTALENDGFTVDSVGPAEIPRNVEDFEKYHAVIVSDIQRDFLDDAQMRAIATYVGDLGGGFILAGGEANYGEGGYSKTVIEDVLPVTFDLKKKKEDPTVSMIVVLDKSGSMGGQKIELAKEATKAAATVLRDQDRFGVVAFDYNFYWPVRLQTVANRGPIMQAISTIIAGGETNIYPALREAYIQLFTAPSQIKHVILLSDGRSLPDDYQGLVAKMMEAKITVSSVAVGSGSDRELLANIANWGKGRSYYIEDATKVPQIFTQETQLAAKGTLKEDPFKPVVKKTVDAFKGINFAEAPPLLGYVATQAKENSEILLESSNDEEPDPILARWNYGLGRSVAFTSDVKDRWAAEWLTWNGYPKFWAQVVRETMRRDESDEFEFRIARDGQEARLTINAIEKDGRFRNRLDSEVRVVAPDQSASTVVMRQVGPGAYEATVPLPQKGNYLFRAAAGDASGASRILTYSYPDEFHFYPPNTDLLRSVSEQTGGKFQPEVADIFNTQGQSTRLPTPLWPALAALALVLYLADVFLRRVRLFENN